MAEQILGQTFAAVGVIGGKGVFAAAVDVEAAVFPGKQVGEAVGAEVFTVAEGLQETVAELRDRYFAVNLRKIAETSSVDFTARAVPLVVEGE
jgi:hypothetical protein